MAHFAKEACVALLFTVLVCAGVAWAQDDSSGSGTEWQWYSASGSGGYWGPATEAPTSEPAAETDDTTGDEYPTPAPIPAPQCVVEDFSVCDTYPRG